MYYNYFVMKRFMNLLTSILDYCRIFLTNTISAAMQVELESRSFVFKRDQFQLYSQPTERAFIYVIVSQTRNSMLYR